VTTDGHHLLVDEPLPHVRRLTLNRPEKRNALNNALRGDLFAALRAADGDAGVRVTIIRGTGPCFSAGYDLSADLSADRPYPTAGGDGSWPRHVVEGWFAIWDLAKPVIAQVHGWCLAGGTELARGVRPRLCGRRCADRLSARAPHEPARHAVPSVARRDAAGHGADADR